MTSATREELRPCPFCGQPGDKIDIDYNHDGECYEVQCIWDDGCDAMVTGPTRAAAIAAWNRRASDEETEQKIAAAEQERDAYGVEVTRLRIGVAMALDMPVHPVCPDDSKIIARAAVVYARAPDDTTDDEMRRTLR